jgi:hypothetical protein
MSGISEYSQGTKDSLPPTDGSGPQAPPRPVAKTLAEIATQDTGDPGELLRHRFLCKGGGMLLVGSTGIGKSALAMQLAVAWALGRSEIGIEPVGPLKSLFVQAENDDWDLVEMRDGVARGMGLSDEKRNTAFGNVLVFTEDSRSGTVFWESTVRPLLEDNRPDLLWIDPALAYLGGDANAQAEVGTFLRMGLTPLLREFECGGIVLHHTNKPPPPGSQHAPASGDPAYLGTGSAEWANWPRAILTLRLTRTPEVFELWAAKRGKRLGWTSVTGDPTLAKAIAHSQLPGTIHWREMTDEECDEIRGKVAGKYKRGRPPATPEDLVALVPAEGTIEKSQLTDYVAPENGFSVRRAKAVLTRLVSSGELFEWKIPRAGKKCALGISRHPQPDTPSIP